MQNAKITRILSFDILVYNYIMSNSFGNLFRITTCGESHGKAIGVIIDGCPAGLKLTEADIQRALDRRATGQSKITTQRKEKDKVKIMSGVADGITLGTPILLLVENKDIKSDDYKNLKNIYRPSHADYTYVAKYGIRDYKGGGRASARETVARVAAGAVAQKYLREKAKIKFISYVEQVANIKAEIDYKKVKIQDIESNIIRCPNKTAALEMIKLIEDTKKQGDSVGGIIFGAIKGVPAGLGEPVFDRLEADLAKAMISINASKAFSIGSGFRGTKMLGSEHNDEIYATAKGEVKTRTNNSGGVVGGISNGEDIYFRVGFKPTATIGQTQLTIDKNKKAVKLKAIGRHDPCVLPRAVPIVDAMAALVMMDHYLVQKINNANI